jgi:hypothetical protein
VRNRLNLVPGAAATALYAASIGIIAGTVGCIHAGNLAFGAQAAAFGFVIASALLGFGLWRLHRPQRRAFLDRDYHSE